MMPFCFADFILALVPANIDPSSLTVMVAFAVGGILGDGEWKAFRILEICLDNVIAMDAC